MINFNEVTWYSKLAAIIFFLGILPLLTFYLGMQYGIVLELQKDAEQKYSVMTPPPVSTSSVTGVISYTMVPASGPAYTYPQIIDYPDQAIMERVNQSITDIFGQAGCGPDATDETYEWNIITAVDYAQNDIFSVNASGNFFCGGAYPTNNYTQTLTFDMKTGERIEFQDLFQSFETDQAQILKTIYAAPITVADMNADIAEEEGSCSVVNTLDTLLNYTHDFRLTTTSQSVIMRPQYPHVIEACAEPVTVPVPQLLPFSAEGTILHRL